MTKTESLWIIFLITIKIVRIDAIASIDFNAVAPIHQLFFGGGAKFLWRRKFFLRQNALYQHTLYWSQLMFQRVLKLMHVHIENRINKSNNVFIILEILGEAMAPQPHNGRCGIYTASGCRLRYSRFCCCCCFCRWCCCWCYYHLRLLSPLLMLFRSSLAVTPAAAWCCFHPCRCFHPLLSHLWLLMLPSPLPPVQTAVSACCSCYDANNGDDVIEINILLWMRTDWHYTYI